MFTKAVRGILSTSSTRHNHDTNLYILRLRLSSQYLAALYDSFFHTLIQTIDENEVRDRAAVHSVLIVRGRFLRRPILQVFVLKYARVGLDICGPDDLLPIVRGISP
jgi:hypothetical protein